MRKDGGVNTSEGSAVCFEIKRGGAGHAPPGHKSVSVNVNFMKKRMRKEDKGRTDWDQSRRM